MDIMTNKHVDELDLQILKELQKNARISFNEIARKLGISTATVTNRISKLMKESILLSFLPVINCEPLGMRATVFGLIKVSPESDVLEVGKRLTEIEEIRCIYQISGEYDLMILARCLNHEDAGTLFEKIRKIDGVSEIIKLIAFKKLKEDFSVNFKLIEEDFRKKYR